MHEYDTEDGGKSVWINLKGSARKAGGMVKLQFVSFPRCCDYMFHRAAAWSAESPGILAGVHPAFFLCFYLVKNVNVVAVAKRMHRTID